MPLLSIDELSIGFRGPDLLDNVSAVIERGQRIALLGRNGSGKTTLLRMIAGDVVPDHGAITKQANLRVSRLTQDVPTDLTGTVRDVLLTARQARQQLQDPEQAWQLEHAVDATLSRLQLDPQARFEAHSSGMKRRVLLARAIASQPDLLLLDEPTNHLDLNSILWLEQFLSQWQQTLLFVTHDRTFLRKIATRIWEIDRGKLFDWSCDYDTFLQRKEAALEAEEKQQALFDKRLAEEEAWIRQGIKARRTRNEGRVRALKAMREQRRERRSEEGTAKLNLQTANRSGQLVAELKDVGFAYHDQPIIQDFSTTIIRGDKVGIVGPNGAGKTTLLNLLLGRLEPTAGHVRLGTNIQTAYFDQLRDSLDPDRTVQENVGDGYERVQVGDKTKHILGYLQDFLFTPERARTKVRFLSGGECNRALLAKLMTRPANVVVLDEPTNDLDSETLEMLENQLVGFAGTLLVVSHDRTFLNNVVTSIIAFEGGDVREYSGGYDDWQAAVWRGNRARSSRSSTQPEPAVREASGGKTSGASEAGSSSPSPARLSYKEQRELSGLPAQIELLEGNVARLHEQLAEPDFYQQPKDVITAATGKLRDVEQQLEKCYARWEELEARG